MPHRVQIDNERVVVTRWTLRRGEDTGRHRHERDYVVVPLSDAQMTVTPDNGSVTTVEVEAGVAYFRNAGVEHNVANEGDKTLDFVEVEVRSAP